MHGLSLNVRANLDHFRLLVPCGLHGRPVTSLEQELGARCPATQQVSNAVVAELTSRFSGALLRAGAARSRPADPALDQIAG